MEFESKVLAAKSALDYLLRDPDERTIIFPCLVDGEEILTEDFFTAELLAMSIQYNGLTKSDEDLIGFIGVLNRLAYQYLMDQKDNEEVE